MTTLADRRARLLASLYAQFGEAAVWTPADGGDPVALTVRRRGEDALTKFGEGSAIERTNTVRVRVGELAAPAIGDQVAGLIDPATGAGQTLKVIGEPRLAENRPEWICEVA